jgi:triosephosphate isomerase
MRYFIANWKMHGEPEKIDGWMQAMAKIPAPAGAEIVFCPPVIWLGVAADAARGISADAARGISADAARGISADAAQGSAIALGAQDCHPEPQGPFTGDISARMIARAGAKYCILGHSERRRGHHETNWLIAQKCKAAKHAGLKPILCIGETLEEREAGETLAVLYNQLRESASELATDCIIAYEPVWAIGTGHTPKPSEIADVHRAIKSWNGELKLSRDSQVPVVYGGSVSAGSAASILSLAEVDGVLVGSASLEAESFSAIINSVTVKAA